MKNIRQHLVQLKFMIVDLDHCISRRTCETLPVNETVEIPLRSTCLSVVHPGSESDHVEIRPLHIKSIEKFIRHI
jgi:hypothetical protein